MVIMLLLVIVVLAILGSWIVLNWVWLRPRKLEKQLREQGLNGTSYRILFGDLKELATMAEDAKSKPIGLSDDVVHRVVPFFHKYTAAYGKTFFAWLGPKPVVQIMDSELIKEILSKYNHFQKPRGRNPLGQLLARGLIFQEGEKWVKHRKIIKKSH